MNEPLILGVVVGYTLKLIKSGKPITKFEKEIKAVRHGDYIKFISLIGGEIPFISVYDNGIITSGNIPPQETDIEFELLIKAGPSLLKFYNESILYYGEINDKDLPDSLFYHLAIFEINIRIHAHNSKLINHQNTLEEAISKLGEHHSILETDLSLIHNGRRFLNMVKHYKRQFMSWEDGVKALAIANSTLAKYGLTE